MGAFVVGAWDGDLVGARVVGAVVVGASLALGAALGAAVPGEHEYVAGSSEAPRRMPVSVSPVPHEEKVPSWMPSLPTLMSSPVKLVHITAAGPWAHMAGKASLFVKTFAGDGGLKYAPLPVITYEASPLGGKMRSAPSTSSTHARGAAASTVETTSKLISITITLDAVIGRKIAPGSGQYHTMVVDDP